LRKHNCDSEVIICLFLGQVPWICWSCWWWCS